MQLRPRLTTALVLFATFVLVWIAPASTALSIQTDDLQAFDGEWLYVEDRTEGRPSEDQGPPMTVKFRLRVEEDAVILVRPRGDEPILLDGSTREVAKNGSKTIYRGEWKDGVLKYDIKSVRNSDKKVVFVFKREFRITPDGMLLRVFNGEPAAREPSAIYRHPENIALPEPAKATIADMNWLSGAWVGERGTASIEESWTSALGGALLGTSRTVKGKKMTGFEFLRIFERGGGLVYVAQPGGRKGTEFVLTEASKSRAVFVNPRHDYPQRIIYELSDEGRLTTSIGFATGGRTSSIEFMRKGN